MVFLGRTLALVNLGFRHGKKPTDPPWGYGRWSVRPDDLNLSDYLAVLDPVGDVLAGALKARQASHHAGVQAAGSPPEPTLDVVERPGADRTGDDFVHVTDATYPPAVGSTRCGRPGWQRFVGPFESRSYRLSNRRLIAGEGY